MNTCDIITYNSDVYLSHNYIANSGIVSSGYLRVAKTRASKGSESWQYMEIFDKTYFNYSSMPVQARYSLPSVQNLRQMAVGFDNDIVSIIKTARELSHLFAPAFNNNESLMMAASVIQEAAKWVKNQNISFNKSKFFIKLATEINIQQLKHLPKTWRNLRDKIKEYAAEKPIETMIVAKNKGNNNRTKFANNDIIKDWIITLAESQKNYSGAYIFRNIRRMCLQSNINDFPSQRWVSSYMSSSEIQYLTHQRYGANSRFNQRYRAYVPTLSAVFAGDCWQIDGTRVNIIDHKATYTEDGKRKTSQKFLYIVAVRDVMSGNVLGWEYCHKENATAVINALSMAVRNTGYMPYELIYDRFPGHNTYEWAFVENQMRMAGTVMTIAHKAEGKAHIERWWGTLQDVFMSNSELYYGEGIKSTRRYAHRSREYVNMMRKWASDNNFGYDDACNETDNIINSYLNTPLSEYSKKFKDIDQSPAQLHEESGKPNTYDISEQQWAFIFGLRKEVSIAHNMITTQIEGATFYYGIDDCDAIARYTGVKLTNCFDFEDLSKVHLFNGDEYIGTFDQITPAQRFGANKDMRAVGKLKKIAADAEKHRQTLRDNMRTEHEATEEPDNEALLLQSGLVQKYAYEAAESAHLLNDWNEDADEKITVNRIDMY